MHPLQDIRRLVTRSRHVSAKNQRRFLFPGPSSHNSSTTSVVRISDAAGTSLAQVGGTFRSRSIRSSSLPYLPVYNLLSSKH
jgi:hypothetical protein